MEGHILSTKKLMLRTTVKNFITYGRFKIINNHYIYRTCNNKTIVETKGYKFRRIFYITIPVGTGIFGYNYWRTTRPNHATNFEINCYCALPLKAFSRWWGWMADTKIPTFLRPYVYGLYISTFGVNISEAKETDLKSYPTLSDFFCRELKDHVRKIDTNACLTSPCDGTVVSCGTAENGIVEQVKGVNYNLEHFLGDWCQKDPQNDCTPDKLLLKNKNNKLYQCTIYLAPGDYHRFHSPTDWKLIKRHHFSGALLSVHPGIASWIPNLFVLNERASYCGYWNDGFFSMTAVGATNVGKIRVFFDKDLTTNIKKQKFTINMCEFDEGTMVKKGDLFGEFRLGSTIVLIFEASPTFQFSVSPGDRVMVGKSLGCSAEHKHQKYVQNKQNNSFNIRSR